MVFDDINEVFRQFGVLPEQYSDLFETKVHIILDALDEGRQVRGSVPTGELMHSLQRGILHLGRIMSFSSI